MGTGIAHTGRRLGGTGAKRVGPPGRLPAERDGERGSILVLFALSIVLFAVLCAVVVDVGYWWVMGKKTQIAADACALAAAAQLPASPAWNRTECVVAGVDYAKKNLPGEGLADEPRYLSTTVRSPYASADGGAPTSYVEAKVRVSVGTFFGRFLGKNSVIVTRRAVAEYSAGTPGNYAIYSHSSVCDKGLEFDGNNRFINGRVHSNGQFLIGNTGSPFWARVGTRKTTSCGPARSNSIRYGGTNYDTGTRNIFPTTDPDETWPEWFTPADFTCTFSAAEFKFTSGQVIPEGTYCATKLFNINGNNISGKITALAPKIEVDGNNIDLTPFAPNGVLFYNLPNTSPGGDGGPGGMPPPSCSGDSVEMKLSNGNDSTWKGKVFHPCERVLVNGNGTSSLEGAIYGLQVKVNGNGFNMTGTGGAGGTTTALALVE
jgi:Putative Flp pilus-assembly TadE/G-like